MTTIFLSVTLWTVITTVKCASYQRYGETTSSYGGYGAYGSSNGLGVSNGLGYGVTNGYGSAYGSGYGVSNSYGYSSTGYPSSTSVPYRSSTYSSLGVSDTNRYPNYIPGSYSTTRQPYNYNSYSTSGSSNLYSSSGSNGYHLQRYGEKYGSTGYGSSGYGSSGYATSGYGSTGLGSTGYGYGSTGQGSSAYGLGSSGYGLGSSGYGQGSSGYGMSSSGYGLGSGYGVGSSGYGQGSSGYGLGSSGYGMGSSGYGLGSTGYGMGSSGSGLGSSRYGAGSSGYGLGSSGYGSSRYGSTLGSSGYGSSMSGGYGSGGYNSYETPFMRDIGGCMNRSPQTQIFVESIMGMWYGVEVIQHTGFDFRREYEYEQTCIVIHISEPLDRPSTENQLHHVAALNAKFRQTNRHLRLLWDENGHTIEYPLYFRNDSAGYWHVLDSQNGTLTQRPNFQQFTGTIQVLSATPDHLVLNFCQEAAGGRPAQLYSVLFSRNPAEISSWELDSVHAMLQGKKLSIASRRMVCGNNGADRAMQSIFLSILVSLLACFVSGSS